MTIYEKCPECGLGKPIVSTLRLTTSKKGSSRQHYSCGTVVSNRDGTVISEGEICLKNRLKDAENMLDDVSRVYDHITSGRISKPNTCSDVVIAEAEAVTDAEWTKYLAEETKGLVEERDAAVGEVNRMKPVVEAAIILYRTCDALEAEELEENELLDKLAVDLCSAIEEYIRPNSAIAQDTDISGESAE